MEWWCKDDDVVIYSVDEGMVIEMYHRSEEDVMVKKKKLGEKKMMGW